MGGNLIGQYQKTMIIKYNGRPIGIDTIATTIGEEPETVEDVYEPYL